VKVKKGAKTMSFQNKQVVCDIKGCDNSTIIFHVKDIGWKWINQKHICPTHADRIVFDKNFKYEFKK
jgi:hypothetical protein